MNIVDRGLSAVLEMKKYTTLSRGHHPPKGRGCASSKGRDFPDGARQKSPSSAIPRLPSVPNRLEKTADSQSRLCRRSNSTLCPPTLSLTSSHLAKPNPTQDPKTSPQKSPSQRQTWQSQRPEEKGTNRTTHWWMTPRIEAPVRTQADVPSPAQHGQRRCVVGEGRRAWFSRLLRG